MATVAHVDARFTADTSAYVRSVRDAQRATESLANSMPRADDAMGSMKTSTIALGAALGTLGAQALTRATGLVKQFAMQGVQAAKDYEQTVISIEGIFQGMGMSVEEATTKTKSYLADLRDFAAETPFELPQTLDAVKRLLSIGYAADDVKDQLLPAIGDIVSALGQPASSISAVVYAFGQMKSAGRVLSQDLMQIGNALPGFNAKVAIAEQLFSGDMQAMAEAMEKGSLDSETAIQAIIKAMQEFPGAAGAMERQSKTLAGVMSTFSDTVNNALIDGLMPSMPLLSNALMGVMPAVEAMAEGFAQQLGPALIQGAELMQDVVPIASALIPPIFELVDIFTGMSEILTMLAGPIVTLADGLGSLIDLFNALPGPIKTTVAVLTTLWLLSRRYQQGWENANNRVKASFATMRGAATTTAASVTASMMSPRIAMEMLGVTAKKVGVGVVAAFRAMGVAAKTFMVSLGPIGWAIAAVSVAFEVFSGKSAEAEALVGQLKATVDETTGSLTHLSAAMMGQQFRMDLSKEDQIALEQMGIGVDEWVAAIMAGGPAVDHMRSKIQAVVDANSALGISYNTTGDLAVIALRNFEGMADAAGLLAEEQAAAAEAAAHAEYVAAQQSMAANRARSKEYRATAQEAINSGERTYAVTSGLAYAHQDYADAAVRSQTLVTGVTQATELAVRALQTAYEELNSLFSDVRAADRAYTALQEMKAQLQGNNAGIDEYTEAAMANRNAVLSYAEAQVEVAKSMDDPIAAMEVLTETQKQVRKSLEGQGIDPKKSDLYNSIKGSIDAAKDEVENMDTAVENAKAAGLDVTNAIAEGIKAGMTEQESAINASGLVAGETLIEGMNAGAGVSSPSTFAITAGRMVGVGMVQGLIQTSGQVRSTGNTISSALIQGMITTLNNGQGSVAAAARAVVAAAIQAAKDEGGIASPSKVFMKIGDDLIKGLRLGWLNGAHSFVKDIARTVQDAYWAMMDSRDAVKDAKKALAQESKAVAKAMEDVEKATKRLNKIKKKDGATKEQIKEAERELREAEKALKKAQRDAPRAVAKAQRDLARAYRDAADAAREYAEAQRNVNAVQKLAKMPLPKDFLPTFDFKGKKGMNPLEIAQGIVDNIGKGFDAARRLLVQRARRAGMTREAAEAYADTVMETVGRQIERRQRLLEQAMDKLAKLREQIEKLEAQRDERMEAGKTFAKSIADRFGEPSEFDRAYAAAEVTVDQAIQLFDRYSELIRQRFTGLEDQGGADYTVAVLEKRTAALIKLIKERDAIRERLNQAEKDLEELVNKRKELEKRLADSIRGFFKPSGKISSADEYITGLKQRVAATKKYMDDVAALQKRGVSQGTIDQILEMGVESGGALAAALANASDAQLQQVNALTAQSEDMATKFGTTQADLMYAAGVKSQTELVNGIKKEYADKEGEIKAVVAQIEALFAGLTDANMVTGEAAALALLAGLKSQEQVLLDYIRKLAEEIRKTLLDAMKPPGKPGGGGNNNGRTGTGRSAASTVVPVAPTVPTTTGAGITVSPGGVQVAVSVGAGQDPSVARDSVKLAVMEALSEVAARAANARR